MHILVAKEQVNRQSVYANAFPKQFYNKKINQLTLHRKSFEKIKSIRYRKLDIQNQYIDNAKVKNI